MKRRLSLETLEDRLFLATLAVHGTDEADVFEFSPGRISVNGVEQVYDVGENPLVLIDGLSGESTRLVALEGSLQRTGDVATTAQRIQTGILGTNFYSAPTTRANTELATAPPVIASGTAGTSGGGGAMAAGTYQYKFVWAAGAYLPPPPAMPPALTEGTPSDVVTATIVGGGSSLNLTNIPVAPPSTVYDFIRIYRRETAGPAAFNFIAEVATGTATYSDTMLNATALGRPTLDETVLTGNYNYYVTFASTAGGPGAGIESRPAPITNPIKVADGRILLGGLPTTNQAQPKDGMWQVRRVYRNLATDDATFHFIGEIADTTSAVTISDNLPDAAITPNATIDLNGPKITTATLLTDVLVRDGSDYSQVFQTGPLELAGKKGGKPLGPAKFDVTSSSTVWELIDFIVQSAGIQPVTSDPDDPIPGDTPSGRNPGGMVSSDGRIIVTGNNGLANAVQVELPGLSFEQLQAAVGAGAATDLMVFDSDEPVYQVLLTAVLETRDAASTIYRWFAENSTGLITFDLSGELVDATNRTVSIDGEFAFDLDFSRLSIGPSRLATLQDTIVVTGSSGDDTAILRPGFATVSGPTFEIRVAHVPVIRVVGGGGIDIAQLFDSARNDHFLAAPDEATLSGPGFENRVEEFEYVHAYAKAGGIDVAELSDGEGDDRFRATPTYGRLVGNTVAAPPASPTRPFVLRAKFFDYVHAYARNGGYDRAYLFDSAGDDVFIKKDAYGKLRGDGFLNRAKFFESVRAYASMGNDGARLFAGQGDQLSAKGNRADLWTAVAATVYDFDWVRAISGDASNRRDVQSVDYLLTFVGPWLV